MAKWIMKERGRRWHYVDDVGKILGFACSTFGGWDGYACTGKKWPYAQKYLYAKDTRIYGARRAVEDWIKAAAPLPREEPTK